jgi:hypothetical protein
MHLGDFGAAVKELDPTTEKDTFTFAGEEFTVVEELPAVLILQVGAFMTGKVDESEGMGAMWSALEISLGTDDFARFYKLALSSRAAVETLMELVMAIFQATGGERPTVQVLDSPVGESPTSPNSSTSSSPPPVSGEVLSSVEDRDPSVPHLVPVRQVLAG